MSLGFVVAPEEDGDWGDSDDEVKDSQLALALALHEPPSTTAADPDDPETPGEFKTNQDVGRLESDPPKSKIHSNQRTRYFVMKSGSHKNLVLSIDNNVWATQRHNEEKLNEALQNSPHVILIFSVNSSGAFHGYAKMIGVVGESKKAHVFREFGRSFDVRWLRLEDLGFGEVTDVLNPWNENKSVKVSRDGQELPNDAGRRVCEMIDSRVYRADPAGYATDANEVETGGFKPVLPSGAAAPVATAAHPPRGVTDALCCGSSIVAACGAQLPGPWRPPPAYGHPHYPGALGAGWGGQPPPHPQAHTFHLAPMSLPGYPVHAYYPPYPGQDMHPSSYSSYSSYSDYSDSDLDDAKDPKKILVPGSSIQQPVSLPFAQPLAPTPPVTAPAPLVAAAPGQLDHHHHASASKPHKPHKHHRGEAEHRLAQAGAKDKKEKKEKRRKAERQVNGTGGDVVKDTSKLKKEAKEGRNHKDKSKPKKEAKEGKSRDDKCAKEGRMATDGKKPKDRKERKERREVDDKGRAKEHKRNKRKDKTVEPPPAPKAVLLISAAQRQAGDRQRRVRPEGTERRDEVVDPKRRHKRVRRSRRREGEAEDAGGVEDARQHSTVWPPTSGPPQDWVGNNVALASAGRAPHRQLHTPYGSSSQPPTSSRPLACSMPGNGYAGHAGGPPLEWRGVAPSNHR